MKDTSSAPWPIKPLGDLCRIELGSTPARKSAAMWDPDRTTENVWLSIADLPQSLHAVATESKEYVSDLAAKNMRLIPKGSLLVSFKLTLGRLAYAGRDLFSNEAIASLLDIDERQISKEFLYWALTAFDWHKAAEGDQKVKGKTLNKAKLKTIPIPLPPLEEQQRIVAVLDEAFEGLARARAHAEANLQNARDILESQLGSQFLVGSPDWVEKKMGDICGLITDGKHGDCENEDGSGYYFLSAKDVKNGTLNYDGSRQITFADFQETHRRTDLSAGDVLVTNAGTIGRTAIAQDDPRTERTTFQKSVAVLKPKREVIDSNFLELGLRANLVNLQKLSAGAAQKNLLLRDLRSFIVRMPERIEEQMRVADDFAKFQAKVELLENKALGKLQDLDDLCQSLLQKAFAGELT